jgi:hypothetical protein
VTARFVDRARRENAAVLAYLDGRNERGSPDALAPEEVPDPYYGLGGHPDVVERVWRELAPDAGWRAVVLGRPALVEPAAGTVLALALGTCYWLRLATGDLAPALASGAVQQHRYGDTGVLDAASTLGPAWVLGSWDEREPAWLAAAGDDDRAATTAV